MNGSERIRLEQHVRVLEVERKGRRVTVDVYGGAGATCGIVVYEFPDTPTSQAQEQVLRWWRDAATVLTFVHRDDEVALIDDVAQFEASWAAEPQNDLTH
ncbi:MAG TPA: hypothetical protein VM933_09070 [Acidimicrobiales bacterium]|nr:hypothetical protein [Acidimicrobiales bacterium]